MFELVFYSVSAFITKVLSKGLEKGECLCNKGQTCWHADKEEEQGSAFKPLARIDVPRGQKEVNRCDDERDNRDGQQRSSPQGLF